MTALTIVTYHYVRDLAASAFPQLAACDAARFERQLDHIASQHNVVGQDAVLAALDGGKPLPQDPCLLTFDDGYRDHARICAPALARRGWSGIFFPAASASGERRLLEVNKIQFVLAANDDRAALRQELIALIEEHRDEQTPTVAELDAAWRKPGRWDDADTVFVKRVLQQGLQPGLRDLLADILFRRHVSQDEAGFADDLYLDRCDMEAMSQAGMAFGSHGSRHVRLPLLDDETLADDLDRSLVFLRENGIDLTGGWSLCYPHGAQDARVRAAAATRGCVLGVTIEPRVATIGVDDRLALPRLDTNDVPT